MMQPKKPVATKPAPEPSALSREEVYLVESDIDPTVLIGRFAGTRAGRLFWEDTNRERLFTVAEIVSTTAPITVKTKEGPTYKFTPMTLEIYNAKVKAKVELSPDFDSTEALKKFYKSTSFG